MAFPVQRTFFWKYKRMATNLSLWMSVRAVNAQYQSAVLISDLITFAAYAMSELQHQVVYNVLSVAITTG